MQTDSVYARAALYPLFMNGSWDVHVRPPGLLRTVLTKNEEYRADNPELQTGFRD